MVSVVGPAKLLRSIGISDKEPFSVFLLDINY